MTRAPRLTTKVLRGLVIIRRALIVGAPLRDRVALDMENPDVRRALQWIDHSRIHREQTDGRRWLDA